MGGENVAVEEIRPRAAPPLVVEVGAAADGGIAGVAVRGGVVGAEGALVDETAGAAGAMAGGGGGSGVVGAFAGPLVVCRQGRR